MTRTIPRAEVAKHKTEDDLWIIIETSVYDVTEWWKRHPGGKIPLTQLGGRDATIAFLVYHPEYVRGRYLKSFEIGTIPAHERSEKVAGFVKLKEDMEKDGIFDTNYSDYALTICILVVSIVLSLFLATRNTVISAFVSGLFMALFWQQSAFIGHDVVHTAVTHESRVEWYVGLVVSVCFGVGTEWYHKHHHAHHVTPNSVDWDPDMQHLPFMALDYRCLDGFYSFFHQKRFPFDEFAATMVRRQHHLFFPIMAGCGRLAMNILSIVRYFEDDLTAFQRVTGLMTLGIYWTWYIALCKYVFSTWALMFLFVWTSYTAVGILHIQVTLSHLCVDGYVGRIQKEYADDDVVMAWCKLQTETAIDLDVPYGMGWFNGGLEYQIIHHLFPRISRHKLLQAREKYVGPYLKSLGVPYNSTGWFNCLHLVLCRVYDLSKLADAVKVNPGYVPRMASVLVIVSWFGLWLAPPLVNLFSL